MPSLRNYGAAAVSASATGITALNAVTYWSCGFWLWWNWAVGAIYSHNAGSGRQGHRVGVNSATGILRTSIGDASGSVNVDSPPGFLRGLETHHYAVVIPQHGASGYLLYLRDAVLLARVAFNRTPTTGGTRTTVIGENVGGYLPGAVFDLQIFPEIALGLGEVRAMMNVSAPQIRYGARFCRYWRPDAAASRYIRSEGGIAAALAQSTTAGACGAFAEPPWREFLGMA